MPTWSMTHPTSAIFLALILSPALASAQQRYSCSPDKLRTGNDIVMVHTAGHDGVRLTEHFTQRAGHCTHVALFGDVRIRADLRDVEAIDDDGYATFHEITESREQRLEIRSEGTRLTRRYRVNGRDAAFDAAAEQWLAAQLLRFARRSGYDAEGRVAMLRSRGGVDAVLREIALLETDSARRRYFRALIDASPPLGARESERVLLQAVDQIRSDGDRRTLLMNSMERGRQLPPRVLRTAMASMRSDGDRSAVLVHAARIGALTADDATREAFFAGARELRSDGDLRRVLIAALRAEPSERVAHGVLASTSELRSDGDKAAVLVAVAGLDVTLRSESLLQAYGDAAATIRSSGDRARALRALRR